MRVVFVWREGEDYSRTVEDWITEFERQTGKEVESISPDGRDGVGFCQAYDIMEYPTILVLSNDGSVLESWRGIRDLPTFDAVSYWL